MRYLLRHEFVFRQNIIISARAINVLESYFSLQYSRWNHMLLMTIFSQHVCAMITIFLAMILLIWKLNSVLIIYARYSLTYLKTRLPIIIMLVCTSMCKLNIAKYLTNFRSCVIKLKVRYIILLYMALYILLILCLLVMFTFYWSYEKPVLYCTIYFSNNRIYKH